MCDGFAIVGFGFLAMPLLEGYIRKALNDYQEHGHMLRLCLRLKYNQCLW